MKHRRTTPLWLIVLATFGGLAGLLVALFLASAFISAKRGHNALCVCGTFTWVPEHTPIAAINRFHRCHYCRRTIDELTLRALYDKWKEEQDAKKQGRTLPDPIGVLPDSSVNFDVRPRH